MKKISKLQIKYKNEKIRLVLFAVLLLLLLGLSGTLLRVAYARYEIRSKINANIEKALYIFNDEKMSFSIDDLGLIPSDDSYTYTFSVANFNSDRHSDVDLEYGIKVRTTTNLPITVKMYRGTSTTNILGGAVVTQDEDGAYYRTYSCNEMYEMNYLADVTDVYTLVVDFPSSYSENPVYADYLESIEIVLDSHQIVGEE